MLVEYQKSFCWFYIVDWMKCVFVSIGVKLWRLDHKDANCLGALGNQIRGLLTKTPNKIFVSAQQAVLRKSTQKNSKQQHKNTITPSPTSTWDKSSSTASKPTIQNIIIIKNSLAGHAVKTRRDWSHFWAERNHFSWQRKNVRIVATWWLLLGALGL